MDLCRGIPGRAVELLAVARRAPALNAEKPPVRRSADRQSHLSLVPIGQPGSAVRDRLDLAICTLGSLEPRPAEEWLKLAHKVEDALVGQLTEAFRDLREYCITRTSG